MDTLTRLDSIAREAHAEAVSALLGAALHPHHESMADDARLAADAADKAGWALVSFVDALSDNPPDARVADALRELVSTREHRRDALRKALPA